MSGEEIRFVYINPDGRVVNKDTDHRGFMRYVIMKDNPEHDDYVELRQIFINEEHRQKGYGKKFIRFLVGLAHKEDLKAIYVCTTAREEQVFGKFLVATGFKRSFKVKKPEDLLPQNLPHFPFKKTIKKYATKNSKTKKR